MVNGEGVMKREGRAIQRQSIWCAGLAGLSRLPNHTHETDRRNQMDQIPATRREMVQRRLFMSTDPD
jgi:hypothetical protein